MKKSISIAFLSLFLSAPLLRAQNPEAIYIATWKTMSELGTPVTPDPDDPKLSFNAETGCYEGEIIDWPRLQVNPYNAKIPYSISDDVITYYGVAGTTQQIIFNTSDSSSFTFEASDSPANFKGFGISSANTNALEDVKVSMDLSTNRITFTQFESGMGAVVPQLVSIDPENGSTIFLNEEGGATITLTFDGCVTSMVVNSDDSSITPVSNEEGTVWTIPIPARVVNSSANSFDGKLAIKIQKVYANEYPVSFYGGNPTLNLLYTIDGLTHNASFVLKGNEDGLKTLNIYKYPEYSVGDEVDLEPENYQITYSNSVTYLFTVANGYEVTITSDIDPNDGENWKTAEGHSTKKGPNGETTNTPAAYGVALTLYEGASDGVFTINVSTPEAGISSLTDSSSSYKVYRLDGTKVIETENQGTLNSLEPGIYIINGKKTIIK